MITKSSFICFVGLLVIGFFSPAWAYVPSNTTVWIATMENTSEKIPTEQLRPKQQTETTPAAEPTNPKQTTDKQSSFSQEGAKPFNPYDMKALKQFDAGDHRAKE